jgi:Bacterial regulatory helix-turn-helix protein, lysR family
MLPLIPVSRQMDTLLSMKVFRQVVESGSFVGAAVRLNLSTAMTSKHLMHLEKHLGTRLLNRSSRSFPTARWRTLKTERCVLPGRSADDGGPVD